MPLLPNAASAQETRYGGLRVESATRKFAWGPKYFGITAPPSEKSGQEEHHSTQIHAHVNGPRTIKAIEKTSRPHVNNAWSTVGNEGLVEGNRNLGGRKFTS